MDALSQLEALADREFKPDPRRTRPYKVQEIAGRLLDALRGLLIEHSAVTENGTEYCRRDGFAYPCPDVRTISDAIADYRFPASLLKCWTGKEEPPL